MLSPQGAWRLYFRRKAGRSPARVACGRGDDGDLSAVISVPVSRRRRLGYLPLRSADPLR